MVTLGEKLREKRAKLGLSLEEISKETKIKAEFLSYIENGDYSSLPPASYAQGFVRNYIKYLGLSEKEMMALFRREYDSEKEYKVLPQGFEAKDEFPIRSFKLRQTFFIVFGVFVLLICYILFQYRYAFINPPLNINFPKDKQVISDTQITVTGETEPNSTVYINKEIVSVDSGGNFSKTISVFPGNLILNVKAINKFGKTTEVNEKLQIKAAY